jgi:hypothetical protein
LLERLLIITSPPVDCTPCGGVYKKKESVKDTTDISALGLHYLRSITVSRTAEHLACWMLQLLSSELLYPRLKQHTAPPAAMSSKVHTPWEIFMQNK